AILSGYVVPLGNFTPQQLFIIYLAGNALEILIGYLLFVVAYFCKSPPVVATLVYLGIWSIASSAIFYTLMSLIGLYGDWINIYTAPLPLWVGVTGVCHAFIAGSIIYMLKGRAPRLWFLRKTRPDWAESFDRLDAEVEETATHENLLRLAWLYYEGSLDDMAKEELDRSVELNKNDPEPFMLYGWLAFNKSKLDDAERFFMQVVNHITSNPTQKARAYMAIADCELARLSRASGNRIDPKQAYTEALKAYTAASEADLHLGDPRFYRAIMLNKLNLFDEAAQELQALDGYVWLDQTLLARVPEQMQIAIKQTPAKQ
ncbi:MAG: tetratricopeptide repeat protein, partial [Terriglobales bacterium]